MNNPRYFTVFLVFVTVVFFSHIVFFSLHTFGTLGAVRDRRALVLRVRKYVVNRVVSRVVYWHAVAP